MGGWGDGSGRWGDISFSLLPAKSSLLRAPSPYHQTYSASPTYFSLKNASCCHSRHQEICNPVVFLH
ncbi:MAG: hypothetical protein F6K58_27040 [Symploca sp. SIO2E9]|nr:hypothetical protein [Symploca sp. SIO2E9]